MSKTYFELGPSPYDEPCAQLGAEDYLSQHQIELKALINQLYRVFPDAIDEGLYFRKKWFSHDFGDYAEVVVWFDDEKDSHNEMVRIIEENFPANWDEEALLELAKGSV